MFAWLKNSNVAEKDATLGRSAVVAFVAFLVCWLGLYAKIGLQLSSQLFGCPFFGGIFSLINVVVVFPIAVLVGFVVRLIAEFIMRRPMPARIVIPWLVPILFGLFAGATSYLGRSPPVLFERFLDTPMPASVTGFEYWWTTAPGDVPFGLKFTINPRDFNKLLAGHEFIEMTRRDEIKMELGNWFNGGYFSPQIALPTSPLTHLYKHENAPGQGTPVIIVVLTTDRWDEVIVCGDYMK